MATRVFLLDPPFADEAGDGMPHFLALGHQRAGWEISRAIAYRPGMDGRRWLAELRQSIEGADILLSLGNFHALRQTGSDLGVFLDLIDQKLISGAFGLFDGCSSLTNGHFPDLDIQIRSLFERKGIRLSFKKVASRVQDYKEHTSPYCCAFRKVDDCLLDPNLFEGVDAVWCYGNRLISYDDAFPLIEAGPLHQYIDQADLQTSGALGQRNAVAVRKKNIMVFSGSVLSDRRETGMSQLGGWLPGIEDNRLLAERLIDALSETPAPSTFTIAFELFFELERLLGQMIEDVLGRAQSEPEFLKELPAKVLSKLKQSDGSIDYSRAMFLHLVLIVRDRWPRFQVVFEKARGRTVDVSEVAKPLFEINEMRTLVAHPHKARQLGRGISPDEINSIRQMLALLRAAASVASSSTV